MSFVAHGNYVIKNSDEQLVIEASGPFNIEIIEILDQALKKVVLKFRNKTWHQIIILHAESIFTPEAEAALCKTLKYRIDHGLAFSAVIIKASTCEALIKKQISRCYKKLNIPYQFFKHTDEAKRKLKTL